MGILARRIRHFDNRGAPRGGSRVVVVAAATMMAFLFVAADQASAGANGTTSSPPPTWPAYTDPTDTHETNNAWYSFKDTGGTAVGDSVDWVGNAPFSLTDQLNVALGIANYGTTDVFYAGADGGLLMTPWDLTPVPDAPTSSLSATTVVPAQSGGVGYVGVCEVGGAQPDAIVFYVKGDPTVAANRTTLYWRAITDNWSTENSVVMPGDFLSGSTWDQVPGATGAWFLHGTVVALTNAFAFVSMSSGEVDTYVSNLLAPGAPGAVDEMTAWTPITASGQQVRDVDAIPFTYRNSVYLALGSLYGTPTTNSDWHWGSIIKQWTGMQAAVRVCSVGDDGSCAVTTSTSFSVTTDPDPGPSNDGSGLKMQSGALNIRLVRGGVTNGPLGDVLTVVTRTFGTLDRMLINDNTHGVTNHYDTDQPELLDAFEVTVDHSSQDAPGLIGSPQRYSGWRRRGLMSDGSNDLETTKTVYQLIDAQGLVSRNFFVTTVVLADPNGPTVPSGITPSPTASPSSSASPSPSPSATPLVYSSSRQRIVWATATQLQAQGVNVKNLDDLTAYTGVVGAVGYLSSDTLQPVKSDTTDQDGNPLASPMPYPQTIPADDSDLQLIGIIYGSPPMSLNGNAQADLFPDSVYGPSEYSLVAFGDKSDVGATTVDETEGSAGLALDLEGEGEHGLKFPFEPEVSWQTEREDVESSSVEVTTSQSFGPNPSGAMKGIGLFKEISAFELQRYARRDWDGGDIGTDGVDESVFVTNPVNNAAVVSGFTPETFTLDDPGCDAGEASFAGMAARADTFDPAAWLGVDPLADTDHVALLDQDDTSPGSTTATLSRTSDVGGIVSAQFCSTATTQEDVVSNGVAAKLKIPFFSGDYSMIHKVYDTTTASQTTEVSLGLPQAPAGEEAGSVAKLTVQAYWLRAIDDQAYWIPTAFSTGSTYATPWCIDYQVTEYELYPDSTAATSQPQCRVALLSSPSNGGSVRMLNQERMASGAKLGTADEDGELIQAKPAPGFRFVGWKLHGAGIARLRAVGSQKASVSATGLGGVTAVARFARVTPRRAQVARQGRGVWSVAIEKAPLGERPSRLLPWLQGKATRSEQPLTLRFGTDAYAVPRKAWGRAVRDGHTIYTTHWRPRSWSGEGRVRLTVDTTSRRWSLVVRGGRVSQAMLRVAGGSLPVQFVCPGQATQPGFPVACSATFKAASTRPAGIARGARDAGPVDLRRATIATVVDTHRPKAARFVLAGVHLKSRLFRRSGMELAVNGTAIRVGRFKKDGNAYVAKARVAGGVRGECRYAAGILSLSLAGGDLSGRLIDEFVVQNVVLTVGSGDDAPSGSMAPVATSVTGVRPAPAATSWVL